MLVEVNGEPEGAIERAIVRPKRPESINVDAINVW